MALGMGRYVWYCHVWRTRYTSKFIAHVCDLGDRAYPRTEERANKTAQEEHARGPPLRGYLHSQIK